MIYVILDHRHEPNTLHYWHYFEKENEAAEEADRIRAYYNCLPNAIEVFPMERYVKDDI